MMLLPVSAEFTALCQAQMRLVAQMVGADSAAVYLAESWTEQALPKLIPIATYPAELDSQSASSQRGYAADKVLPTTASSGDTIASWQEPIAFDDGLVDVAAHEHDELLALPDFATTKPESDVRQRLAVPLLHEGQMLGILVSWRTDHPWNAQEQTSLEDCARSLTLACMLDQRGQWLSTQMVSLDQVQTRQSDRLHELLHQLRSPLTALKTFGKLLNKRMPPDDPNQALVINMLRESDRLQELLSYFDETLQAVDDSRDALVTSVPLLAPASIGSESVPPALPVTVDTLAHFGGALKIQPHWVGDLILPLLELFSPLAEAEGIAFHLFPPRQDAAIQADPYALTEILNNFLDNALKYASAGSEVWIQWGLTRADRPDLEGILVGDTGPGIPTADQPHVFERHFRGIQAMGELEGSGLGLAIAQDLVQEMQGDLRVYSPLRDMPWSIPEAIAYLPDTQGTAFVIWLPKAELRLSEP
jgi:signal transduction histidine kinase